MSSRRRTELEPPCSSLIASAQRWILDDPDPDTRVEIERLLEIGDGSALSDRFDARLKFGTAGLRGEIGAGPNRMNRVVVAHASAGLAEFLKDARGPRPRVIVGCDARTKSDQFARDAAGVLAGAGCEVLMLPHQLPTPVLAFAVRHFGAQAGVMITASHNPGTDNGYKVYLGDEDGGAQIVSPIDTEIEDRIQQVSAVPFDRILRGEFALVGEEIVSAYAVATASAVGPRWATGAPTPTSDEEDALRAVYTPMHGVGLHTLRAVLSAAGYGLPDVVAEQAVPDGAFPTLAFPNPEEPGALDLAKSLARAERAHIIIANDPDADRLAVAVIDGESETGYRMLTGDELGVLLAWWSAERAVRNGQTGAFAASVVSAPALERIAAKYGMTCQRTLSGFKWISRVPNLVYGYEEALGYLVNPETVRDKDGISAALAVLEIAHELHAAGSSIGSKVTELGAEFAGMYGVSFSLRESIYGTLDNAMRQLRNHPEPRVGGRTVVAVDDYISGLRDLPPTNLLAWHLEDGSRVMIRPSGTEPKLKFYIHSNTHEQAEEIASVVRRLI